MSTIDERLEAATRGDLAYLKQHVVADDVEEGDHHGYRVLHYAAQKGHLECVEWLVEKRNANVDAKTRVGYTPLSGAAAWGRVDVCEYLLRQVVYVDEPDRHHRSALYWAIRMDKKECVRLLINSGARISLVVVDHAIHSIPDYIHRNEAAKEACRSTSLLLMGLYRKRKVAVFRGNGYDALFIISRIVWGSRGDQAWDRVADEMKGK